MEMEDSRSCRRSKVKKVSLLILTGALLLSFDRAVPAQTYSFELIHSFSSSPFGADPAGPLIQASDGNLYGTTAGGGIHPGGVIFRISNLDGTPVQSLIYNFQGGADGLYPSSPLIQAIDGSLYGTTIHGGGASTCYLGCGTVFKISNLGGVPAESVVYAFAGGGDGDGPTGLLQAADGNLYGTTTSGGANGPGTIYRISNLGGTPTESVLYSFAGGADGSSPYGSLIQAFDGNLYGTTEGGGGATTCYYGCGTVFTLTNLSGSPTESLVYSFAGSTTDGAIPTAAVFQASDGNLYGTTTQGGAYGSGIVFRIINPGSLPMESVLYSFTGGSNGGDPQASLVQGSDGNLYGTAKSGGGGGVGLVFKISGLAGTPTEGTVYSFAGWAPDGAYPEAAVMQSSGGESLRNYDVRRRSERRRNGVRAERYRGNTR